MHKCEGGLSVENCIRINNLSKTYGSRRLFHNVSMIVPDRSVLVLHGPNGSGKTTFLKILCGLLSPTSGQVEVVVSGEVLSAEGKRAALGLVSPELRLYDGLSAVENLEFFAAVRGVPFSVERAREMLEYVGLKGRGRDPLSTYSAGMKQRLKYACALWHKPHVLVLDEPASHMDEQGASLVDKVISRQRGCGIVLLATNDPQEQRYGDQVYAFA